MCFFFAAACQADGVEPTEEEFLDARNELSCELGLLCGTIPSEDQCPTSTALGPCSDYHSETANACLDAMQDALDEAMDDAGTCMNPNVAPDACKEVISYNTEGECGTTAGRPLHIDGVTVLPAVRRTGSGRAVASDVERAAEHWLACARTESASVPAFERLAAELRGLGAPRALELAALEAAADEQRHTTLCLDHANALSGETFALEPMGPVRTRSGITLEQIAAEALLEGCIAEGSAAAWAALVRQSAGPSVQDVLTTIATDELAHATLGWRVLGWALSRRPRIATRLFAELDRWEREHLGAPPAEARRGLHRFGVLSTAQEHRITSELVRTVVRPTLARLRRRHPCYDIRRGFTA